MLKIKETLLAIFLVLTSGVGAFQTVDKDDVIFGDTAVYSFIKYNWQDDFAYFNTAVTNWVFGSSTTSTDALVEVQGDFAVVGTSTSDIYCIDHDSPDCISSWPTGISDHNLLNNLNWSVAGHVIDTDLDLAGNDLLNAGNLNISNWDSAYSHISLTNNPHNVLATQITDFDTEVLNNSSVVANTAKISYTDSAAVALNTTHRGLTNNPHSVTFDQIVGGINSLSTSDTAGTETYILANAASGNLTITLPAASSNTGKMYIIKKIDSSDNIVIIDGNASETIDGDTTKEIYFQYTSLQIFCDGSNWHIT